MRLYELFVGFRYLKSKKSQGFISSNTLLSIIIVFLGVFILIIVNSVMSGFQSAIKDKILDIDSHITVSKAFNHSSSGGMRDYNSVIDKIEKIPGIKSAQPIIQGQGLFRSGSNITYVMIRGIGFGKKMPDDVKKFIKAGPKEFKSWNGVYIGQEMAANYGLDIGSWIELIVPKGRLAATTGVTPGIGRFKVAGLFKTGYYDFDTKLIIVSLKQAQNLFAVGNTVWGVGIKIDDVYQMREMAKRVRSTIGYNYLTMTAQERNQNLFYALKLERLIMTIILFLVIISAGFTIMGTLVMVVMEKRKAVGILKSMGAKPNSIMIIFVLEGFFIGVIGSVLGALAGLAASLNLSAIIQWVEDQINNIKYFIYELFNLGIPERTVIIPDQIYYIEGIPTQISPEFVTFIAIFAVFLCTVAAIFPSWNASRMQPVETIRYE